MTSNPNLPSRRIASAVIAIAVTVALHGGWLHGMNRDAAVATSPAIHA